MRRSQAGRTWRVSSDAPSCVARYAQLQLPRGARVEIDCILHLD